MARDATVGGTRITQTPTPLVTSAPTAEAYKALIVSDIGLTYKRGHDQHLVYATRIHDAQPLSDVEVRLRTYQNQVAARGTTNDRGLARLEDVGEEIFYVEAEHQGSAQRDQTQRHGLEPVEL